MKSLLQTLLILLALLCGERVSFSQETKDLEYAVQCHQLAMQEYNLCHYSEAIRLETDAMDIIKEVLGEEHPAYATTQNNLAQCIFAVGNYEEAIRLAKQTLEIRRKVLGETHPDYALSLNNLASYYYEIGNYREALKLGTEALEILGDKHPDYALFLNNLAKYNSAIGNYEDAIRLGTHALEIYKEKLGEEHPLYATSLSNLASYFSKLANYEEAIELGTKALEIRRKVLGEEHMEYVQSLNEVALYNYHLGHYTDAIKMELQVLEITRTILGKEHPTYAILLNNLAQYYSAIGDYEEAIKWTTQAVEIKRKVFGEENPHYALSLNNLANIYSNVGYYDKAINLATKALEIKRKSFGEEHPEYAQSLNTLAHLHSQLGNFSEALRLATKALEIRRKIYGEEHPDYAMTLSNLANYYSKFGNFTEAIRLEKQATKIRREMLGEEHPDYAISLNNLANYYSGTRNYTEAIKLGMQSVKILKKTLGEEHPNYATSLDNLAQYYSNLGNYEEAIGLDSQALLIRKNALGEEHSAYSQSLNNLALDYYHLDNYREAIKLTTEALNIVRRILGDEHPDYASSLSNLAVYYVYNKDEKQLSITSNEATTRITDLVKKTFSYLTSVERTIFWEQYKNWFEMLCHGFTYLFPNPSLISDAYNSALLSKGLLLNSDIAFNQLILESGDSVAVKMYEQLRRSRLQLNRLLEKPIVERMMNTDSLRNVVSEQEKALVEQSKVYGDFTKNLVIDWKQVQEKLGKKDIAVEFISFPWKYSTMYVAYTLRKDWKNPKMTVLFDEKQLKAIPSDSLYVSPAVSQLVWGPLAEDLSDAENIYFSPGGELYNIAIEYVPDAKTGKPFSEAKNLHRLSSTRELALIKEDKEAWKSAAVYGGLKYNMDGEDIVSDSHRERGISLASTSVPAFSESSTTDLSFSTPYCSIDSLRVRRDSIGYLPGTLIEAKNVAKSLEQAHVSTVTYTDTLGTEPSFKALSGKRTNVLHIGTHGFYWNESEAHSASNRLSFLRMDNDRQGRYVEDKALTRSGLLMAGANWALAGKYLPDGVDDGILTAKELTTLDLRGLDLVVMSACQTGLGEITGDGVFGLQRGFKKAGANSLLMSLWKVDDKATQMLMTRFFDNLSQGKSKYEALKEAQQHLQDYTIMVEEQPQSAVTFELEQNRIAEEKEKTFVEKHPYEDPQFWAAFILVDGIR